MYECLLDAMELHLHFYLIFRRVGFQCASGLWRRQVVPCLPSFQLQTTPQVRKGSIKQGQSILITENQHGDIGGHKVENASQNRFSSAIDKNQL
jgi:hypothetical protein